MIIEVLEANDMPLERWTAYMTSKACSMGYGVGKFSIGTLNGMSRITINK